MTRAAQNATGPDGYKKQFIYGPLPNCGYTNLYPTQVIHHLETGTLPEVGDFEYDCAKGILKNTVNESSLSAKALTSAAANYDLFGRRAR